MPGIFISYRRDDTAGYAGRLTADLAAHFDPGLVFRDTDTLELGKPYADEIEQFINTCDVLILLLGRRWLTATDEHGRRRLDDPADLHRREITTVLGRDARVIPVLVDGARMPHEEDLPEGLTALAGLQALEITERHWRDDVQHLIRTVDTEICRRDLARPRATELTPFEETGGGPSGAHSLTSAIRVIWLVGAGIGEAGYVVPRLLPQPLGVSTFWWVGGALAAYLTTLALTGTGRIQRRALWIAIVVGLAIMLIDALTYNWIRLSVGRTLNVGGVPKAGQDFADDLLMVVNAMLCAVIGTWVVATAASRRDWPAVGTSRRQIVVAAAAGAALGVLLQLGTQYLLRWPAQDWPDRLRFAVWLVAGATLLWRWRRRAWAPIAPPPPEDRAPHPM